MTWLHGRAFTDFAFGHEILGRYEFGAAQLPSPSRSVLWYPRIYLGDAAPWTLFIVAAAAWALLRRRDFDAQTRRGLALVAIWFVTVFLVFTPARFKASHYILPAYPAAALLAGLFLDHAFRQQTPRRLWHIPLVVTAVSAVAAGVVLALLLNRGFGTPWIGIGMLLPC